MNTPRRAPTPKEIQARLDLLFGPELARKVRLRATRISVGDGRTHAEVTIGIPSPEINAAVTKRLADIGIARRGVGDDIDHIE